LAGFAALFCCDMTNFTDLLGAPVSRRRLLLGSLTLSLTLPGCGRRRTSEQGIVDLFIQSDGDFLAFKPDELTCPTGVQIRLTFHHSGRFLSALHNWVLAYPDQMEAVDKEAEKTDGIISADDSRVIAVVPMCGKGETVMTEFLAPPPGDYPFFCSTPGHAVDMNGILHVTA
jgi:azurin